MDSYVWSYRNGNVSNGSLGQGRKASPPLSRFPGSNYASSLFSPTRVANVDCYPTLNDNYNQFNFPLRSNSSGNSQMSPSHRSSGSLNVNGPGVVAYGPEDLQKAQWLPVTAVSRRFGRGSAQPMGRGQRNFRGTGRGAGKGNCVNNSVVSNEVNHSPEPRQSYEVLTRPERMNSDNTGEIKGENGNNSDKIVEDGKNNCNNKENSNIDEKTEDEKDDGNKISKNFLAQVADIAKFHNVGVEYRLTKEVGPPHSPTFTVEVALGSEKFEGQGSSIKKAQNCAAIEAIENTTLKKPIPKQGMKRPYVMGNVASKWKYTRKNYWAFVKLNALCEELKEPWHFSKDPVPMDPFINGDSPWKVRVNIGERIFTGEGSNYNAAKSMATMVALKAMLQVKQEKETMKIEENELHENSISGMNCKSPISMVHEMAMKRGLKVVFEVTNESGPAHMKTFTVTCNVGTDLVTVGEGNTKQFAKKVASEEMIQKLKDIPFKPYAGTGNGGANDLPSFKDLQKTFNKPKTGRKKIAPVLKDVEHQTNLSPISRIIQIARLKKFKEPSFELISSDDGEEESSADSNGILPKRLSRRDKRTLRKKKVHCFTMEVTIGPHKCVGSGSSKKAAKKAAAEAALIKLGCAPPESAVESEGEALTVIESPKSNESSACCPEVGLKITSVKPLAPGLFAVTNEQPKSAALKIVDSKKTGNGVGSSVEKSASSTTPSSDDSSESDGLLEFEQKLNYLARLLNVKVSYSNFPKSNAFLTVVSFATSPPFVAHGVGSTLPAAKDKAAENMIQELEAKGLDSLLGPKEEGEASDQGETTTNA